MPSEKIFPVNIFELLLASRGILRIKMDHPEDGLSIPFSDSGESSPEPRITTDLNNAVNIIHDIHLFPSGASLDFPDDFYCSESFESLYRGRKFDPADDLFFTYKSKTKTNGVSNPSSPNILRDAESESFKQTVRENYEAYHSWEHHDITTEKEIFPIIDHGFRGTIPEAAGNGGVYYTCRPELTSTDSDDVSLMLQLSPAAKFRDLVDLELRSVDKLNGLDSSLKYKNNLSTVIGTHNNTEYLLVCCQSDILVYEFDEQHNGPRTEPSLTITTRPFVTSARDRISLTWPFYPHTLNSIISPPDWVDGPVVVACSDDGRVLVWHVASLISHIKELKSKNTNCIYGTRIACDFLLNLNSSAWGVDVKTALDIYGKKHHILAASDNTKRITLFYYHETLQKFSRIETHQVLHNIPEVSFINYTIHGNYHHAILTCGTIFGELITFKFEFRLMDDITVSPSTNEPIRFKPPVVTRRTCLGSDCWTSKPIHSKYFKKVQSLRAMIGNHNIDEGAETSRILSESKIISPILKSSFMADLGVASRWQFFETPVVNLTDETNTPEDESATRFCSSQEECRRMFLMFKDVFDERKDTGMASLHEIFLAVSTDKKLGLFRADTLFCAAATKPPFKYNFLTDDETQWCNRILISELIPELLIFIAVTQLGLVTIMRLCEHRGVYGMRQEHLFPNVQKLSEFEGGYRTIIGISIRDLSPLKFYPRFLLYLVYSDGLVLTYQLQNRSGYWNI